MVRRAIAGILAATLLLALSAGHSTSHAATINVACNTTALIQALEAANNETTNPGADTLELAVGCVYLLTAPHPGSDGGLPVTDTTIIVNGNGSTIMRDSGAPQFRILRINANGDLTLNRVTLTGGRAPDPSTPAGAPGHSGGAIFSHGLLTLIETTLTNNRAGNGAAGIAGNGGAGGGGGAVHLTSSADGLTIRGSTISGNVAGNGGNGVVPNQGGGGGDGGGIYIDGQPGATANISNSTISGNTAGNGGTVPGGIAGTAGDGGGVYDSIGAKLTNATISGNSAAGNLAGGYYNGAGAAVAKNTIIANNAPVNCTFSFPGPSANNLASDGSCGGGATFTQKTPAEINLGPLADNGGPTQTMALTSPSAAIDAGDNATCAAAPVNNLDQRGVFRPIDGDNSGGATCDIGAFEYQPPQADPNFVVNSTAEDDDGACHPLPLDCTLREAINAANANPSLSIITLDNAVTYTLTSVLPQISHPLTINGNGSTIYRDFPAPHFRLITYCCSGSLTLNELTIRGGRAPNGPGAGQPGADGGGIKATGSLLLNNSTIIANEAGTGGNNGILGGNGGNGGHGGGIWVSGAATITNSTISGNSAGHGGTARMDPHVTGHIGGDGGHGGGVFVASGSLNVVNSTIVGNSAGNGGAGYNPGGNGGWGGGAYTAAAVSGNVTNVTMSSNSAGGAQNGAAGSGGAVHLFSPFTSKNSIIANSGAGGNCSGAIFGGASTNNMSSDASCGGSFTISGQINLGPAQDNGGPTMTMALQPGSAAIDTGDSLVCAAAPVNNLDQRGVTRPIDGDNSGGATCDIGAYEAPAQQAGPEFTVNSTADDNDGLCQFLPDDCTLREAINAANGDGLASTVVLGNEQTYSLHAADNPISGLPPISTDITIQGNGSTITRDGAAPQFRIFRVMGTGILTIQDATVSGGYAPALDGIGGGAIRLDAGGAVHVLGSTISGNRSGDGTGGGGGKPGGGIFAVNATLTLTDSTVSENIAGNGEPGTGGAGGHGGGIYFSGTGTLTVNRSMVAGNMGGDGGSNGGVGGSGGGLFIEPAAVPTIANSTIANNHAGDGSMFAPGGNGGGIVNFSAGLVLTNVTISANAVGLGGNPGEGGNIYSAAAATSRNSIISGPNLGFNCFGAPFNPVSASNLASDASCSPGFTQQTTGQINLGTLANNGGPTQTMALVAPSSAMDTGDSATCAAPPGNGRDQRGYMRPLDGDGFGGAACDIGAFEACPPVADCDGDGYSDNQEFGTPLCGGAAPKNDDNLDDAVIDDGCPGGPPVAGTFSEGQARIGTNPGYPCGVGGWPSNLFDGGLSANKLDIQDVVSFVAPVRHLDKSPTQAGYDSRWDLLPGTGSQVFQTHINIVDITTLVNASTGNPPMFDSTRAFGKTCPLPP